MNTFIVQATPAPTFKTIPKHTRPRQPPNTISHVYWMFPTIMVSSNARNPVAGDPSMDLTPQQTMSLWTEPYAPILLSAQTTAEYIALCPRPKIAQAEDSTRDATATFVINDNVQARIMEQYIQFHEQDMDFAAEIGRLHILAPQNLSPAGPHDSPNVPHFLIATMYTLMDESRIRLALNTKYTLRSQLIDALNHLYENMGKAIACADVVMLSVLDACAILGGVELPKWPPNVEWRGAIIDPKSLRKQDVEPSQDEIRLLATIRRLERWGVPIWTMIVGSRSSARLDATRNGLPSADPCEELLYQDMLKNLATSVNPPQSQQILNMTARVHTHDVSVATYSGLPAGIERHRLQRAIIGLLDHHSPHHINFVSFSAVAQDVLGPVIWTGNRHEAALHPASFDISEKMPWSRVRDGIRDCAHCGVNIALFQIPLPWINAHSSVTTAAGEYLASEQFVLSITATHRGSWFLLEVDDFTSDDGFMFQKLATRFSDRVHGWSFVQSGLQRKDANGKTIPRSRFTGRLLFKQQHVRESVAKRIANEFSKHEQSTRNIVDAKDDFLFNFTFFVHPHFADVAYGEPISAASRREVMHLAPPFDVLASSSGSKDRARQVKWSIHTLRHVELFEIKKFPPFLSPSPSFPHSRVNGHSLYGLDMSSCPPGVLGQLASAATPTNELSFVDICRMQRFAYLMEVLAKNGSFSCRVFASDGPYRKILQYLSLTIRNLSPAGSAFVSRSNRQQISPFHEAVRLTPSGRVEIIINVDPCESRIEPPSQHDFELYNATLEKQWGDFSKKLSRSEARHQRVAKQIANALAAGSNTLSRS
jgi:hypothetical protein